MFLLVCLVSWNTLRPALGDILHNVENIGKCESVDNCCIGRDSSCFVTKEVNPHLFNGGSNSIDFHKPCYCDEGCLETGDCCADYEEVCNIKGKKILRGYYLWVRQLIESCDVVQQFNYTKIGTNMS